MSEEKDKYNGNNRNIKSKNYRKNWSSSNNQRPNNQRSHNDNNKKSFPRPGPFGFKPRTVSGREEAIANPFGFASHNGLGPQENRETKEQKPDDNPPILTLPEEDY